MTVQDDRKESQETSSITERLLGGVFAAGLGAVIGAGYGWFSRETGIPPDMAQYAVNGALIVTGVYTAGTFLELGTTSPENSENARPKRTSRQSEYGIPKPGLDRAINKVFEGTQNRGLASKTRSNLDAAISKYPLEQMEMTYRDNKNSLIANHFGVFDSFTHEGRTIDPKQSLDNFFDCARSLHTHTTDAVSHAIGRLVDPAYNGQSYMNHELFVDQIDTQVELARDVALWAQQLSARDDMAGIVVRNKLASVGISNPDQLPQDVRRIGDNILKIYKRLDTVHR